MAPRKMKVTYRPMGTARPATNGIAHRDVGGAIVLEAKSASWLRMATHGSQSLQIREQTRKCAGSLRQMHRSHEQDYR